MTKRILMIFVVGMLSACVSGKKAPDSYVGLDGKTVIIENDAETCRRSCNDTYSRCMDSSFTETNDGYNGPSGVFGASAECRSNLQACLRSCK